MCTVRVCPSAAQVSWGAVHSCVGLGGRRRVLKYCMNNEASRKHVTTFHYKHEMLTLRVDDG